MPAVTYRPRYTLGDYEQWEGDWELWDGIPVAMSPRPNIPHQRLVGRLLIQLEGQLRADPCRHRCEALPEVEWRIDESTVVCPDLVILCGERGDDFLTRPPEFAAEVLSPATRRKDLAAKRELYALNGVPHYLVADPATRSAQLLEKTDAGEYRDVPPETPVELHPGCKIRLDLASLFRE